MKLHRWTQPIKTRVADKNEYNCSFSFWDICPLSKLIMGAYGLVKDLATEKQGKSTTIQDKSGKCLTEENEIINMWTEYCLDLYNYETERTK